MNILNRSVLREDAPGGGGGGPPPPPPGGGGNPPPPPSGGGAPPPPPPPPPKPFYDGLYGADGKIDKAALDRLPDHLEPHKDWVGRYDTIEALIAGGANANVLASKKALTPLDENAPQAIKDERKAMLDNVNNVPKDPKGYGIVKPAELPEQFWSQEGADRFATIAQKNSLSPAAVKELLALQMEVTQGELTKGKAMETDYYTGQDKEYEVAIQKMGMDADKAGNMALRGAESLGLDPKSSLFKSAAVRLAAIRHASLVSESKLITGEGAGGEQIWNELAQARDIMSNPQNPLHKAWKDPTDPRHEAAKDKVNALYQTYGERTSKKA